MKHRAMYRRDGSQRRARLSFLMAVGAVGFLTAGLTGCGVAGTKSTANTGGVATGNSLQGRAFGGQQPIAGAAIQLYGISISGYGTASAQLLSGYRSDANGRFNITNGYTCFGPGQLLFLTATGGNPGIAGTNSNIALMAALGPCSGLNSSTFVEVNELTTVASVYALSAFMAGPTQVGTTSTNYGGLALAFADVNQLVSIATGTVSGPSLPGGATLPVSKIDTLANIIAACINSAGGIAGDNSPCGNLFSLAKSANGTAPTDTVTAIMNIAQNPGANVSALFGLATAQAPFSPQLAFAPNDWLLAINYAPSGLSAPSSIAIDTYGNAWIANRNGNTVTELSHTGALETASTYSGTLSAPSALALDASGNPWVTTSGNSGLTYLTPTTGSTVTGGAGGLNIPSAVAIDPQGNVWATNSGTSTVSEFTSAGHPISANGFSGIGIDKPLGIAISPH